VYRYPSASSNDRFVALELLKNANVAAVGGLYKFANSVDPYSLKPPGFNP
jgi:hypothetical protein